MNIDETKLRKALKLLYGSNKNILNYQYERFDKLFYKHKDYFGDKDVHLFSAPGRTELGGNHTDHNNGRVLAASVNLDAIGVCSTNETNEVKIFSEGYDDPFIEIGRAHV